MNILFLTLVKINSLEERGIYQDLLRKFSKEGHHISIACPTERREGLTTTLVDNEDCRILKIKTFNLQKTTILEKGIGTLAIEYQFLSAIKKYFKNIKFDLILYSTPPITFYSVISYLKKRDNAYSYLLLKDIFPQNAVDLGLMKEKGVLHRFFRRKEKKLYKISDTIGCMSPANVRFVLSQNKDLPETKVEVNPNTIEPVSFKIDFQEKSRIRVKYAIPVDSIVFLYGGNLGKPQGLQFLFQTILAEVHPKAFFLIVGTGTELLKVKEFFSQHRPSNAKFIESIPKMEYDSLASACDVGLIFLHKNFTIPNFPSRLLSYLEMSLPVIAATDPHTDMGAIIEEASCGFKVLSGDISRMHYAVNLLCENTQLREKMAENATALLNEKYLVKYSYLPIISKLNESKFQPS